MVADSNRFGRQRSCFNAFRYRRFDIRFHQTISEVPKHRLTNVLIYAFAVVIKQFVVKFAIRSNVINRRLIDGCAGYTLARIRCIDAHGRRQTIAQTNHTNAILCARWQHIQFGRVVEIIQMQRQQLNLCRWPKKKTKSIWSSGFAENKNATLVTYIIDAAVYCLIKYFKAAEAVVLSIFPRHRHRVRSHIVDRHVRDQRTKLLGRHLAKRSTAQHRWVFASNESFAWLQYLLMVTHPSPQRLRFAWTIVRIICV